MEEKQVYIFFETTEYKFNKAELLKCKANLILIQKNFAQLAAIRSRKKRLLIELAKSFSSAHYVVTKLENKMPEQDLPKELMRAIGEKSARKPKRDETHSKKEKENFFEVDSSSLDKELFELNKKIKELTR